MSRLWAVCGLWFVVVACLRVPRTTTHEPRTVSIAAFTFTPGELTVTAGDTVVWTNDDALPHTTSADSGAWSSPELRRGEHYRFVPRRAGRFPYHCSAHPVMRAALVVRP
jgi:plastocyanin